MNSNLQKHDSGRQRLAWVILLGSFFVCLSITIAVPFVANAYLQNATDFLAVTVQANKGTVGIDDEMDVNQAVRVGEPGRPAFPGNSIRTDAIASALVSVAPPDDERLLARLQLYGNTIVTMEQAQAPRFKMSDAGYELRLDLEGGRLRLSLPEFEGRPFQTAIATPQGTVTISEPGQYSLIVNNEETQVAVQDGRAHVVAANHFIDLEADQRSVIPTGGMPSRPLGTERNLIQNSDFGDGWDQWRQHVWDMERADQPAGHIDVEIVNGEPTLYIRREGEGHAEVRVRQSVNQDVTDFASLELQLTFRVVGQTLGVCGVQGSECPLFLRIDYDDQTGVSRVWQQGFYSVGEIVEGITPDTCAYCAVVQGSHDPVTMGQVQFYEADLLGELARQGAPPISFIKGVELVASGHSFEVEIVEAALLAEE
ncbi:MAG: hypothetical protein GY803_22810 [Chloroflexi bacterium]|nr:hypothetical protein [Chloroflexota bacterium]